MKLDCLKAGYSSMSTYLCVSLHARMCLTLLQNMYVSDEISTLCTGDISQWITLEFTYLLQCCSVIWARQLLISLLLSFMGYYSILQVCLESLDGIRWLVIIAPSPSGSWLFTQNFCIPAVDSETIYACTSYPYSKGMADVTCSPVHRVWLIVS